MNRPSDLPPLSDVQLEVMQEVWARGEVTVTDVWQSLQAKREVARNTILTLMDRLEKKGWLSKRAVANAHLYKATVSQKKTMGQVVKNFVETTFDGAADQMVVALLESGGVSSKELDRIAKLIEEKKKSK